MAAKKQTPLRVVSDDDEPAKPLDLLEAVEAGDFLAIMKAQRRIIAESLLTAPDNTRPQFSNELNKLNALIREEESRQLVETGDASVVAPVEVEAWNGTGY